MEAKLIDDKIESLALKYKLIEGIVRFRLLDYQRSAPRELDDDRLTGLAIKVADPLKRMVEKNPKEDPVSSSFVTILEREVLLIAVPKNDWMKLICLCKERKFDGKAFITVNYDDDKGSQHAMSFLPSIQPAFLFIELFRLDEQMTASLTDEAKQLVAEYCNRNTIPEIKYDISSQSPSIGFPRKPCMNTIDRAWKPAA
ncbi:MAG TPA: hypothetical protein PLN21_12930 [Gemmatales bacterium]|nr:hypothetical protein [Gemmatales bacterium]